MNSVKRQITPLKPTSLPQIVIVDAWCKGCAICVEFCPKHVFVMKDNLPVVVDLQACNRCMLCEMRCPDFSLTVE
jgi:2-oxoglutarate ferredoxin oxidoreductase subunit delta